MKRFLAAVLAACSLLLPAIASAQSAAPLPPSFYVTPGYFMWDGGTNRTILTASSPTACTSIQSTPGALRRINYAGTSAETSTITFYDEGGGSPACATGDKIFAIVLSASYISPPIDILLYSGLAYSLSASLHANTYIGLN